MSATESVQEYKGKKYPVLSLESTGLKFPFGFGLSKANAIVANIDAIQNFAKKHNTEAKSKKLDVKKLDKKQLLEMLLELQK